MKLSTEVKYLGLTLDKGLTSKNQLDKVRNKAYTASRTSKRTCGKITQIEIRGVTHNDRRTTYRTCVT
jgi:hypothetical protein